jgi:L-cysteine S-thiosulfotransferase
MFNGQLLKRLMAGVVLITPVVSCFAQDDMSSQRGRAIVANRQVGLCLLCHSAPIPEERFQGNLAPNLALLVQGKTSQQLKNMIENPAIDHPGTIMPSYGKTDHLQRLPQHLRGKVILSNEQIDDVVAYLMSLQKP